MSLEVADLFASLSIRPNEAQFSKADKLLEGLKRGLEAFAGFEAVKKIGEMVERVVDAAVGVERLGQKIGVSTAAVQELGYAADVSGASTEDLQISIQHLSRGLEEMRTKGTGPAVDAFQSLGVSLSEIKGKGADEVLMVLAEHFKALPDGVQKTALAMDLFGRSGTNLIPLLDRGKDGIAELRAEAEKLGVVLDEKTIKAADQFEESQKRLKATLTGLKNEAVGALLPGLTKMAEKLQKWIEEHRPEIEKALTIALKGLEFAMEAVIFVFEKGTEAMAFLAEHADIVKAVLLALGIVMAAFAAESAVAWAVAAAPVLGVIAAITGIILVVNDLLHALIDGKGVIYSVFKFIGEGLRRELRYIGDAIGWVKGLFETVSSAISSAFHAVLGWIEAKINWVIDQAEAAWDFVKKIAHYIAHPGELASAAVDYFTGDDSRGSMAQQGLGWAAAGPSRVIPGVMGGGAPVSVNAPADITINASGTDPQGVIDLANRQIAKHHDRVWRDVATATGGADE